ncbi:hypothetical protein DFH08DRAFT_799086 [Mycena albidolilacea]|uniref:Uncharacterized protein n=1 Tax=Mycena albidolilacea TaxID=1033008 RepID=A0AAD7AQ38_9AGAR|nr:hypothetical protein DFH08DRAFT_799086 [Mycena albidolilacea]
MANLTLVQLLLDLLAHHRMAMALLHNIPTLHIEHVLTSLYKKANWEEYCNQLLEALSDKYEAVESVVAAIHAVKDVIWATTKAIVQFSKLSPYIKRWYIEEMWNLQKHFVPDHPVHMEAWDPVRAYCKAVVQGKVRHWVEWQERLTGDQVWDVHKFLNATPSDRAASRIPMLVQRGGAGCLPMATVESDEDKCSWLCAEFFPLQMPVSSVPPDPIYPPPAWQWKPVSDDLLCRTAEKMKPYKAMFPESMPNCSICYLLDKLGHFPSEWSELRSPVLRKLGKPDYDVPGAYRPIALTKGLLRQLYGTKDNHSLSCLYSIVN